MLLALGCITALHSCRPPERGHATPEAAEELALITSFIPEVGIDEVLELPDAQEVFTLMAEFSANPDARRAMPASGITMLHLACLFKKAELARCLLLDGADPNATTVSGESPLALAVSIRGVEEASITDEQMIQLIDNLIAGGADLNRHVGDDMPLLNYAGLCCYSEKIFLHLMDKGCQPDETTCQAPAMMGWNTALQRLLDKGAGKVPGALDTMLLMAAANLHKDTVQLLLDAGADVNAHQLSGTTPLLEAAGHLLSPAEEEETERRNAILDVCALLIKKGADPELAEMRQDGSPAFRAVDILTKDAGILNELNQRGVNLAPADIQFTSGVSLLEQIGKAAVLEKIPPVEAFEAIATALNPTQEMLQRPSYHDILPMAVELLHSIDPARASQHVAAMPIWSGADAWNKGHGDCLLPALTKCESLVLPKQIICAAAEHLNQANKADNAAYMVELLSRCPDSESEIEQYCHHDSKPLAAGALAAKLRKAGLPTPRDGDVQIWLENNQKTADSPVLKKAELLTSLSRLWYGDMLPAEQEEMLKAMEEIGATQAAARYRAIAAAMDNPDELDKLTADSDSWKFELEIATARFILAHSAAFLTPAP